MSGDVLDRLADRHRSTSRRPACPRCNGRPIPPACFCRSNDPSPRMASAPTRQSSPPSVPCAPSAPQSCTNSSSPSYPTKHPAAAHDTPHRGNPAHLAPQRQEHKTMSITVGLSMTLIDHGDGYRRRYCSRIVTLPAVPRVGEYVIVSPGGWTESVRSVNWSLADETVNVEIGHLDQLDYGVDYDPSDGEDLARIAEDAGWTVAR